MGVGAHRAFGVGQADFADQSEGLLTTLLRRQEIMCLEHFGDLLANPHQRIERRHRLLEHHGDAAAAQRQPFRRAERQQVLAVEQDLAGFSRHRFRQQAHQRMRAHRFAGAGFSDHAEDFSGG